MKWVRVPSNVMVEDPETGDPIGDEAATHWLFLRRSVLSCRSVFGAEGHDGIIAVLHLKELFERAEPGAWVGVEDRDHELVLRVLTGKKMPDVNWNPLVAAQLLPFFDAWIKAPDQRPLQVEADSAA